jgi:hypothetical protein
MKKSILAFLFAVPALAQVSNPSIISVAVAPSGACTSGLPNQQVVSTGVQYSCQNGTWAAIGGGSGSGTVNTGATGQIGYYAADGTTISGNTVNNLLDAKLGSGNQSNIVAALQKQNYFGLPAIEVATANMQTGSGNNPAQLRIMLAGDSTTTFHNFLPLCALVSQFGSAGFDLNGTGGTQLGYGQPCGSGLGVTQNSSTGTITQNNGAGSIVPGTGAPYDFTRWSTGVVTNISSGGSVTYGTGGGSARGTILRVYYLTEPLDGITGAAPGTLTVTATGVSNCTSGCVIGTVALTGASTASGIIQAREPLDSWTLTLAASGGAADIIGIGIYDNTHNGIIAVGLGRGGLSLPDLQSTPSAITQPAFAAANGAPLAITSYSITTNVITVNYSANAYVPAVGEKIILGGFYTSAFLDKTTLTIASVGTNTFTATLPVSHANVGLTSEAGYGWQSDASFAMLYEMKQNGISNGSCQQATGAAPTTFHDYSYWLNSFISEISYQNPAVSAEFTASYPIYPTSTCAAVYNDQQRLVAQQNGYFYFDNFFPATNTQKVNLGQLAPGDVHSNAQEQMAGGQLLVNALGLTGNPFGAMARPVANASVATLANYVGANSPNTPTLGVFNPAVSVTQQPGYAAAKQYSNSSLHYLVDVGNQLLIYDYNHTNPIFCINTSATAGAFPAGCKVTSNYLGQFVLAGTNTNQLTVQNATAGVAALFKSTLNSAGGNVQLTVDRGNASAESTYDMSSLGTLAWRMGMHGNANWSVRDQINSKVPFLITANSPASSLTITTTNVTYGQPLLPGTIYSAAGTALPTCDGTHNVGGTTVVSDATTPTYLTAYASGGAVMSPVMCNGTNWVTY